MRIADAEAAIREAATQLAELPRELATAVHAAAAGKHAHEVKAETWADLRASATDVDDIPDLDKHVQNLGTAISGIKAVIASLA